MSGRSVANSFFDTLTDGEMLVRKSDNSQKGASPMYNDLLNSKDFKTISQALHETRHNWVCETIDLLDAITVPKILVWFSVRKPQYTASFKNVPAFFSDFPQLINQNDQTIC